MVLRQLTFEVGLTPFLILAPSTLALVVRTVCSMYCSIVIINSNVLIISLVVLMHKKDSIHDDVALKKNQLRTFPENILVGLDGSP